MVLARAMRISFTPLILFAALVFCACSGKAKQEAQPPAAITQPDSPGGDLSHSSLTKPKLEDPSQSPGLPSMKASDTDIKARRFLISAKAIRTFSPAEQTKALQARGIEVTEKANIAVAAVKLVYQTTDARGNATQGSGLVAIPLQGVQKFPPLDVVSYQHGTVFSKEQVPSRFTEESRVVSALFAGNGMIVLAPDYLGLGDSPGTHPYLHAATEASATLDLMQAAVEFMSEQKIELSGRLMLAGYSQGGHATLAAHRAFEKSPVAPFKLMGSAPGAGPYDLSNTMVKEALNATSVGGSTKISDGAKNMAKLVAFMTYLLIGWNPIYQFASHWSDLFQEPVATQISKAIAAGNLKPLLDGGLPKQLSDIVRLDQIVEMVSFKSSALFTALEENNVYEWKANAPIHFLHSDADEIVTVKNTDVAAAEMKRLGSSVSVEKITDGSGKALGHVNSAPFAGLAALKWFRSLQK